MADSQVENAIFLGIDTGGTYTDAVLWSEARGVIAKAKALTTRQANLDDRVRRLQTHFGQASKDIDDILVSSSKVTKRGQKIEALEFVDPAAGEPAKGPDANRSAASATGQLRLRVVDED